MTPAVGDSVFSWRSPAAALQRPLSSYRSVPPTRRGPSRRAFLPRRSSPPTHHLPGVGGRRRSCCGSFQPTLPFPLPLPFGDALSRPTSTNSASNVRSAIGIPAVTFWPGLTSTRSPGPRRSWTTGDTTRIRRPGIRASSGGTAGVAARPDTRVLGLIRRSPTTSPAATIPMSRASDRPCRAAATGCRAGRRTARRAHRRLRR